VSTYVVTYGPRHRRSAEPLVCLVEEASFRRAWRAAARLCREGGRCRTQYLTVFQLAPGRWTPQALRLRRDVPEGELPGAGPAASAPLAARREAPSPEPRSTLPTYEHEFTYRRRGDAHEPELGIFTVYASSTVEADALARRLTRGGGRVTTTEGRHLDLEPLRFVARRLRSPGARRGPGEREGPLRLGEREERLFAEALAGRLYDDYQVPRESRLCSVPDS
jgi:hypothetical protein